MKKETKNSPEVLAYFRQIRNNSYSKVKEIRETKRIKIINRLHEVLLLDKDIVEMVDIDKLIKVLKKSRIWYNK